MPQRSKLLSRILDAYPGKRYFGIYRLLPIFFVFGGLIEFAMIHLNVGDINFYDVYMMKHPEVVERMNKSSHSGTVEKLPLKENSFLSEYEKYLQSKTQTSS
ncbi:hypothetical protein RvY_07977 [Ramazzottius varieornatus]|uniref:Small integral membrane protein 4 n=1 Tax=Ramazzottius varieornatus TaxID=947166 RepID=A0A1D1VA11_RAMVA|nr:hypothetical protein RvY_07977 [Ramazzottius varieornatus]